MNLIEAGIFDAGGVLHTVDLDAIKKDIKQTLKLEEVPFTSAWQILTPLLGIGAIDEQEYWERFLEITNCKVPLPAESLLLREYRKNFSFDAEMLAVVRDLKSNGVRLAVLSNTVPPHSRFNREVGLYDHFDVQVLSDEVGVRKPSPRSYLMTVGRLGVRTDQSFLVDDLVENVVAFEALGGRGVLCESARQVRRDLKLLGLPLY